MAAEPNKVVLVTGATGLLGRQVVKAFDRAAGWTVVGTGLSRADGKSVLKVDLCNEEEVKRVVETVKPQVVVHCAANRYPDKVDQDPQGTKQLNVFATKSLAHQCAAHSILMLYISTDYVFSGAPGQAPYSNTATPAPTNLYGQTKLDGETALFEAYAAAAEAEDEKKSGMAVVLRVPVLYGDAEEPGESSVNILMNSVWDAQQKGKTVTMDHWALRYPTNTEDVGRVCKDIAVTYLSAQRGQDKSRRAELPHVLHFSSEDRYTKYDICRLFGQIMGLSIENIVANEQGNDPHASVQRPYDCHLSTQALRDLGVQVSTQDFEAWWKRSVGAFRR